MTDRWLSAWGLAAVAFGGASLIVPLYVVELGGDAFVLGVLFATASFVGVPGALVFGALADRTGKRRVFVLAAMATTVLTMGTIPLFESIPPIIVANALLWLGFAAAVPVLTLLVVADEPADRWTTLIARLNTFQGIGWALGLALGFVVITLGSQVVDTIAAQRAVFVVSAVCAAVGLLLAHRSIPPDPKPGAEPSPRRLRRRVRQSTTFNIRGAAFPFTPGRFDPRDLHPRRFADRFSRRLATYFVAVFTVFSGFGIFFAPLPAYLDDAGYGSSEIFGLYLVLNVGAAVFFGRAALLAGKYDVFPIHVGGLLARGIALPSVAVVGAVVAGGLLGLGGFGAVFVLIGVTWAIIAVTAATVVTTLADPSIRGEALGVYGALVAVGGGVGGLLGGSFAAVSYVLAFAIAGVVVAVGASIVHYVARTETVVPGVTAESV